jgi:hypothetical protein
MGAEAGMQPRIRDERGTSPSLVVEVCKRRFRYLSRFIQVLPIPVRACQVEAFAPNFGAVRIHQSLQQTGVSSQNLHSILLVAVV